MGNEKKAIPEVMVRAVMSLYEGAKTRVGVGLELSEEFEVKVVFAIMVDVVTENVRNDLMSKMLFADDLILTIEKMEELRERLWNERRHLRARG